MNESEPSLKAAIEKLVGLYLAPSRFREPIKSAIEAHNSELDETITMLKALEAQSLEGLREKINEIRSAVERESYWCEDCQKEIPRKYYPDESGFHEDHEVVPITIIAGWRQAELSKIIANSTEENIPT